MPLRACHDLARVQAGAEDCAQDETPKSGRTSPALQHLKGARRSGKLGPSRNASGEMSPDSV